MTTTRNIGATWKQNNPAARREGEAVKTKTRKCPACKHSVYHEIAGIRYCDNSECYFASDISDWNYLSLGMQAAEARMEWTKYSRGPSISKLPHATVLFEKMEKAEAAYATERERRKEKP
jgi:hypothetical protein